MPELAFCRHGEELPLVPLGDRTAIGRASDCDVSLPDPSLSRVHAVVERRGDGFLLLDRSGRGTRLGGRTVHEAALEDGAELTLGAWRALFRTRAAGDDGEATRAASGSTRVRRTTTAGALPPAARIRVREGQEERVESLPLDGVTVGKRGCSDLGLDDAF